MNIKTSRRSTYASVTTCLSWSLMSLQRFCWSCC